MKNKTQIIIRIIIFISTLVAIAGCLMTILTININIMGKNLYSQKMGILTPIKGDNIGGMFDKINSLGLQNNEDIKGKLSKIMIQPIILYFAVTLFIIIILICTLINKLYKIRMILSIASTALEFYLISVIQDLPNKLMQSLNLNKVSGIFNLSQILEIEVGIGQWVMMVAIIVMTLAAIFHVILASANRSDTGFERRE